MKFQGTELLDEYKFKLTWLKKKRKSKQLLISIFVWQNFVNICSRWNEHQSSK
jgi:hypothetical protein